MGFIFPQVEHATFEDSVHFCRGSCLDIPSSQDRNAQQLLTLPVLSNFSPRIGLVNFVYVLRYSTIFIIFICLAKLRSEMNRTKVSHKTLLMKSSGNHFIFLLVFYLIMWVMKASKNFGKIAILKIWELISLWDVKTYIGKLALKWCIFRHEKKYFNWYQVIALDPIRI